MPIVLQSGSLNLLELSGSVQAYDGIALHLPFTLYKVGRGSSVGIAIGYELVGPGIEYR